MRWGFEVEKILLVGVWMFDIKYNVSILPNSPGIYIMKNDKFEVLYVGKAKDLRKRVSQYFQKSQNHSEKSIS